MVPKVSSEVIGSDSSLHFNLSSIKDFFVVSSDLMVASTQGTHQYVHVDSSPVVVSTLVLNQIVVSDSLPTIVSVDLAIVPLLSLDRNVVVPFSIANSTDEGLLGVSGE